MANKSSMLFLKVWSISLYVTESVQKQQSLPPLAKGALPLLGHIVELHKDPVKFFVDAASQVCFVLYGYMFRNQLTDGCVHFEDIYFIHCCYNTKVLAF